MTQSLVSLIRCGREENVLDEACLGPVLYVFLEFGEELATADSGNRWMRRTLWLVIFSEALRCTHALARVTGALDGASAM
jgi:hypothetical protein